MTADEPLEGSGSDSAPAEDSSKPASPPTTSRSPRGSPTGKPLGPRPSTSHPRDQAGSSRTKYYPPSARTEESSSNSLSAESDAHSEDTLVTVTPAEDVDMDNSQPPYRPPEAVEESPEDDLPDYIPGGIAEHPLDDKDDPSRSDSWSEHIERPSAFDSWMDDNNEWGMDLDAQQVERPQIGPGILPRRWLKVVHKHDLIQPRISAITKFDRPPAPTVGHERTPSTTEAQSVERKPDLPEYDRVYNLDDIWSACPGGVEHHHEWYFCLACWGWIRLVAGQGTLPHVDDMQAYLANQPETFRSQPDFDQIYGERHKEWSRFADLQSSKTLAPDTHHHLHEFSTLLEPTEATRIERIEAGKDMEAFPHIDVPIDDDDVDTLTVYPIPDTPARLFASCSSDLWMIVDKGIVPGQLPVGLVNAFTREKSDNPNVGSSPHESVRDAWELISTLLFNPLFKSQRGWVKLENRRFLNKVGTTLLSSRLLQQIGFGCRAESDVLRIGPFMPNDAISLEQVEQMDRYMLRTWVETGMYLSAFLTRNDLQPTSAPQISFVRMDDKLSTDAELGFYRKSTSPYPDSKTQSLITLGVTKFDEWQTIEKAYNLQLSDDSANTKIYLSSLEQISEVNIVGKERLQMKIATERSVGRYTESDLAEAYSKIGFTQDYAAEITVEPEEAPDSHILELHKRANQGASASERREISQALIIIGRDRGSKEMQDLGESGESFMSLEDAYAALSAPRNSIDDGLIMQYQLAVSDFPGKTDHYRNCLAIIADAPGEERPAIKSFLETGKTDGGAPPRTDIPVGLQNIGNTCYLNSILQYMYSIKPLRDEVLAFEQSTSARTTPTTHEEGRSRRFVRQLRLLFLQLYKSDQSSVRPDEELAYLAITRPEVDQLVEPPVAPASPQKLSFLDEIPTIVSGSPSSTRVASPHPSATGSPDAGPGTPSPASPTDRRRQDSVLGKRASTDRDDSSRSSVEHSRLKSEDASMAETPANGDGQEDGYFSLIPKSSDKAQDVPAEVNPASPSAIRHIEALNLRSSPDEDEKMQEPKFSPPTVPPPLPPRPHVGRKDTLASGLRFGGLQQDSAEVLINVLSQLELGLQKPKAETEEPSANLIEELFSCNFRQQLFYESSGGTMEAQTPVDSVFVHPIVGVEEEGKDLYDCLAELYLGGADIEYEGKKGYMMDLMDGFPPFLYIQMRRSQFDLTTGRERKLNTHIAFDQTIAMDRFLVGADASKRQQSIDLTRKLTTARSRLQHLRNNKPMSIPDTFQHVRDSLGVMSEDPALDITSDFLEALTVEGEAAKTEITQLEEQIKQYKETIETIWVGNSEFEYELVAVFMHRGKTSGAGHYWTYQAHLPDHSDEFYKYNDETVTVVPQSEVLQDRTGSDANPALLCYVRKGQNLIDTLHREILEVPRQDEVMEKEEEVQPSMTEPAPEEPLVDTRVE